MMDIQRIDWSLIDKIAPLVADFRVALRAYKGMNSEPNISEAMEELADFMEANHPVFAATDEGVPVGYTACRIEDRLVWVEHLFVCDTHRRRGIASLLFEKVEEIAHAFGENTVFNYVHPNNNGMIHFLRSKGYTVLNLIEIRKPYAGEKLNTTIQVNDQLFDY